MVFVAGGRVWHRRVRRRTENPGKLLAVQQMNLERVIRISDLLPKEFPEQILPFPFR